MTLSDKLKRIVLAKAYEYLDKDPEQNMPKLIDWVEVLDRNGDFARQLPEAKRIAGDPSCNWYRLAQSFWYDVDGEVRKTLFTNFVINGRLLAVPSLTENRKKYGCNIPWAILLDPVPNSRCGAVGGGLSFDEMDGILEQGKELGTYFYLFSGGEPLLRRDDLIALCNKNFDCEFLLFTDGTRIDDNFADELLRVKNLIPVFKVDGFEEETDLRRGRGTYAAQCRGMEILRAHKLPFGVSCHYTEENGKTLGSEEFFDELIRRGVKFAWFFPDMPTGKCGGQLVTAEQREYMYHQIRAFRKTKPLLTLDLLNDNGYVGGCTAAGKSYCHINAAGDLEPCAFVHYSDSNLRGKTLLEAYCSPLFREFYRNQPFHSNLLRSCPLLDDPDRLVAMVEASGARPTGQDAEEDVRDLAQRCAKCAEDWAVIADRLWEEGGTARR